jgi:pyruvate/2-oxoglutarate dehydrogenase complex dihydrolipoamide dehydrogenase (E3) component
MHIASPNAGEVIQGFALAVKKGITYDVSHPANYLFRCCGRI